MKTTKRLCALLLVLGLMMSLFAGCDLLQSDRFRACDRLNEQVARGRGFTKEEVVAKVGEPPYYDGEQEGVDYMDPQVTKWNYEVAEFSGYHWRLSVYFDSAGNVISSEFYAPPGG